MSCRLQRHNCDKWCQLTERPCHESRKEILPPAVKKFWQQPRGVNIVEESFRPGGSEREVENCHLCDSSRRPDVWDSAEWGSDDSWTEAGKRAGDRIDTQQHELSVSVQAQRPRCRSVSEKHNPAFSAESMNETPSVRSGLGFTSRMCGTPSLPSLRSILA